jgi:hypothetical protein
MIAAALAFALVAGPRFVVAPSLQPRAEVERVAAEAWRDLECLHARATGFPPPQAPKPIHLRREASLEVGQGGMSLPGSLAIRQAVPGLLDALAATAIRHELGHQFLWLACPADDGDLLFHEAFAMATSGEIAAWSRGESLSPAAAAERLRAAPEVNTQSARRALSRLLQGEGGRSRLPSVLGLRLLACSSGVRLPPLTVDDLAFPVPVHAVVVLDLRTGAVVVREGAVDEPLPVGPLLARVGIETPGARSPLQVARLYRLLALEQPERLEPFRRKAGAHVGLMMRSAVARLERRVVAGWVVGIRGQRVAVVAARDAKPDRLRPELLARLEVERRPANSPPSAARP